MQSVDDLATPALIIDRGRYLRNLQRMQETTHLRNVGLRPHSKTHKSATIARQQIECGAVGICCAKLGEAEALAGDSIRDILITSPIVSNDSCRRMATLCVEHAIKLVVDHPLQVNRLADAIDANAEVDSIEVLVDVDPGMHRTGCHPENVLSLIQLMDSKQSLKFVGLQLYAGNLMHVTKLSERAKKLKAARRDFAQLIDEIEANGFEVPIRTGGGTGSFDLDSEDEIFTEIQAGSYPFMDVEYLDIEWGTPDGTSPFESSLSVLTTVISCNTKGIATTDGGYKALATDSVNPRLADPKLNSLHYRFAGDEHGIVHGDDVDSTICLGDRLVVTPPHCDPTFNLYDHAYFVEDGNVIEKVAIDARGKST